MIGACTGTSSLPAPDAPDAVVDGRYLLVTAIPAYVDDADGSVWLERRWHRDLSEHLAYLRDLTVCAPRVPRASARGEELVRLEPRAPHRLSFRFLLPQTSYARAVLALPRTLSTLWSAISAADIVHSSVIGWPFPLGWIANPLAVARKRRLIIVVESAWRMRDLGRTRMKHRLADLDPLREVLARWSCRHADLALFTHEGYREALCGASPRAFVAPAVWVNDGDLVPEEEARRRWSELRARPLRLLFAGRLTTTKGIDVLLRAARELDARRQSVHLRVLGEGDATPVRAAAAALTTVKVDVLAPIPYGRALFDLVAEHHAVVVPSVSDEQPRIVFDAFAQAVPVIASATTGLRSYVHQDETGWLFRPGNSTELADVIARAARAPGELEAMGLRARGVAAGLTHRTMHQRRARLIRELCSPRAPTGDWPRGRT